MVERGMKTDKWAGQETAARVEEAVEELVAQARKEEVLETYEDLFQAIWARILPTLGRTTVSTIMGRALGLTTAKCPCLGRLHVARDGLSFDELRVHMGQEEREVMRAALRELVASVIGILAMLTGDILVRQLMSEIEERQGP